MENDNIMATSMPNEKNKRYTFVTNARGRRILIVNRLINVDQTSELDDEDFDAIYINIARRSYEENRLIVRWLSPMRVDKCFLKPRFATSSLEDFMRFASRLIDGFCDSPTDDVFADFIEEVYGNIERYGISRELTNDLSTTARVLTNMMKFEISRGRLTYTNHTVRGLTQGYSSVYLASYDNMETQQFEERMKFNLKMEELGFAEKSNFIDRVHLCPSCGDSHQLFIECCPKCKSSNIRQEQMIHHFRCANVSPESSYDYDGQLVCPKCKRILRHIGVDYDRPATIYNCNCGNTFIASSMRVRCANCGNESTPEELNPVDVWEYKLTQAGLEAFATDEALFQIEANDIYSGRSTYENFVESIRMFNNLFSYEDNVLFVFRYSYTYEGDQENWQIFDIMRTVISQISTVKITTQNSNFYVLVVAHKDKMEAEHNRSKKNLDQIFHDYTAEDNEFAAQWQKTYKLSHGEDTDAFIAQLGENIESQISGNESVVITEKQS